MLHPFVSSAGVGLHPVLQGLGKKTAMFKFCTEVQEVKDSVCVLSVFSGVEQVGMYLKNSGWKILTR